MPKPRGAVEGWGKAAIEPLTANTALPWRSNQAMRYAASGHSATEKRRTQRVALQYCGVARKVKRNRSWLDLSQYIKSKFIMGFNVPVCGEWFYTGLVRLLPWLNDVFAKSLVVITCCGQ